MRTGGIKLNAIFSRKLFIENYIVVYHTHSVIRLSLGKLLVNLLQVVKRTNTPLIP